MRGLWISTALFGQPKKFVMSKHSWNSLQHYLGIHHKTLRFFEKLMETPRVYTHKIENEVTQTLRAAGIIFLTYRGSRVRVDIKKTLEINLSNPKRPRARTFEYRYAASRPNQSPLIRYCSPHGNWEEEGTAPHHRYHHKHDYTKNPKGDVTILGDDDWPHVGEFLEEVLQRF